MKSDLAEKFAAIAVEGITADTAHKIIGEYLTQLVRCPVCDGSGQFTFPRGMTLAVSRDGESGASRITAGTVGSCPACGSDDEDLRGKGDPEFVAWHCVRGHRVEDCRPRTGQRPREGHEDCGLRIMLRLDALREANP